MIDPLSDVLSLLRTRREGAGAIDFGGDWTVRLSPDRGLRCYVVGHGECWIEVENLGAPRKLAANDCIVLTGGRWCRIGSAAEVGTSVECDPSLFSRDQISTVNGGGACLLIGAHFGFDDVHKYLIAKVLPPFLVVRDERKRGTLGLALKALWLELETPEPGGRLVIDHLNQMMLISALRLYVQSGAGHTTGWLTGLADKRIARALAAMHGSPEKSWTLQAGDGGHDVSNRLCRTLQRPRRRCTDGLSIRLANGGGRTSPP